MRVFDPFSPWYWTRRGLGSGILPCCYSIILLLCENSSYEYIFLLCLLAQAAVGYDELDAIACRPLVQLWRLWSDCGALLIEL